MAIDITYFEEKERLEQDRLQLKQCLQDIEAMTYINEFTNKETYIKIYRTLHSKLSKEEMDSRIEIIYNIFYAIHNK